MHWLSGISPEYQVRHFWTNFRLSDLVLAQHLDQAGRQGNGAVAAFRFGWLKAPTSLAHSVE